MVSLIRMIYRSEKPYPALCTLGWYLAHSPADLMEHNLLKVKYIKVFNLKYLENTWFSDITSNANIDQHEILFPTVYYILYFGEKNF